MSIPAVSIANASQNVDILPITSDELSKFIQSVISDKNSTPESIDQLIKEILSKLSSKSSKFKYIVNATIFTINQQSDNNVSSSFGSLWNEKNDGFINLKIKLNDSTFILFNTLFISI